MRGAGLRSGPRGWRGATLAVVAAGWLAAVLANWPGQLSYDSTIQLLDGRSGGYHTWHPPFMAWLLGLADTVAPGAGLYVAGQAALLFGALALLTAIAPQPGPAAAGFALLLSASPLALLWQGIVWKDVLFADLQVAGFAALAAAFARAPGAGRAALVAAAGLLLTAAAMTRQNGALGLLFGAAALAWEGAAARGRPGWAHAGAAALWLALATGAVATASLALASRSVDGNGAAAQVAELQAYDLAGVLARAPEAPLRRLPPPLAAELRRAAAAEYTPVHNDALLADTRLGAGLAETPAQVAAQWRETVASHPVAWLSHRAAVSSWLLFTPDLRRCRADFTGVDGPPAVLRALGLAPRHDSRDRALLAYATGLHRTPMYDHAVYAAAAAALAACLAWRRGPGDRAIAGLLLASLAYAASFAVIGAACDYRYLYPLDLAAWVGGFQAAAGARGLRRRGARPRRRPPRPGARAAGG